MTDKNQELATPEGLEKLQQELAYLTETRRKEVADRIRQAREFGDISENSEYDEAKNEQGLLERRIGELQRRVRNVKVVDPSEVEEDAVDLGTRVTLRVVGRKGQERTFQIVGANESDPTSGKLSHASPVGRAVLKRKVGEKVMVSTPAARRSTRSSTSRRPVRAPGAHGPLLPDSNHRTQLEYRMSETGRSTGIHIPGWADRVADSLGAGPHVVVSGISVSGNIHAGNLREVLVAEAVANALRQRGEEVRFIFHADTIDPLRKIAPGVPESYEQYIGHSLSHIPDPEGCHVSYAEHFLVPFEEALREMEMDIEVLRSHELYERGVYTGVTSEAIEHTDELREILQDVTNRKMPEHWSPYLPRAASGKLTGMRVLEHLPEQTSVVFADEDGWQDSADYSRGEGKLGWRVELAARWKALGVTFEPFGKDHTSRGGSTDTADRMSREVFHYPVPGRYEYEWIGLKGRGDMSSSRGIVLLPEDLLRIMPPAPSGASSSDATPPVASISTWRAASRALWTNTVQRPASPTSPSPISSPSPRP